MAKINDDDLEMIDISSSSSSKRATENRATSNNTKRKKSAPDYEEPDIEEDDEDDEASGKGGNFLQVIMISAIVIIIGIVTVMLIRWQKGIDLVITDDDLTEDYDIESEDFYSVFNPYEVEGYEDDGELNIVILGDKTIYNYDDETGIASLIAKDTGANVQTLALPDSTISLSKPSYTLETATDAFNLYYVVAAMCGGRHGSYDIQQSALDYIDDNGIYNDYLEKLREIDFDKIDILIISYGLNDYQLGRATLGDEIYIDQPYGTMDSLCGALDSSLGSLNDRFPYMQIVISSPSFCFVEDKSGNQIGADLLNPGNGSLGDYVALSKSVAQSHQASFADNYFFSDFNAEKYDGFIDEAGMPNEKARKLLAEHIISFFYMNRN